MSALYFDKKIEKRIEGTRGMPGELNRDKIIVLHIFTCGNRLYSSNMSPNSSVKCFLTAGTSFPSYSIKPEDGFYF